MATHKTCDRCGQVAPTTELLRVLKGWMNYLFPSGWRTIEYELCGACSGELRLFLKGSPLRTQADDSRVTSLLDRIAAQEETISKWERVNTSGDSGRTGTTGSDSKAGTIS
jgi:hypothetical protein